MLLTPEAWRSMALALPAEPELALLALWADGTQVHALFWSGGPVLASVPVEAGLYAALSPARPPAALFERMVADLWGHQAADATDTRPWLDHGTWPLLRPLSDRPAPNASGPEVPEMLAPGGDEIGLGPLPPGTPGTAHWRVGLHGDRIATLEGRLGYVHRGVLGAMRGKSPAGAARLAARISGAATVAHATAFARAVEAALDTLAPPRAAAIRTAALAIERAAMALHDLHAASAAPDAHDLPARAGLLAACHAAFGHRLMLDLVRPGGVAAEPGPDTIPILDAALEAAADGAGASTPRRRSLLADLVAARATLAALPPGPAQVALPHDPGEGLGTADGPQGAVWHWVRLSGGLLTASFAADPAWRLLPAFEAAAVGTPLEALPRTAAAFGLHLPGMEL